MPQMTGSQFIASMFRGYDITHVFFVPEILGNAHNEMKKLGIRPVIAHSEKTAAYMADGYARAAHGPGVCLAQSVGAANLASGLQDAFLGSSPVIAITGHRPSIQKYRNAYQEIEHMPLFEAVTKYNVSVDTIEQLPLLMRQAFREAVTGAPAPVHLDLQGIYGETVANATADLEVVVEEQFKHYPAFRPAPEPERIEEAIHALKTAKRPVMVAGGGVTASQAEKELAELAEKLNIPVATTLNGRTAIPDRHRLAVGVVGVYSRWCANRIVAEADLVLYIGSQTGSQTTVNWKIPKPGTAAIQIDIDPSEPGRNYPAKVSILGDARTALRRMISAVTTSLNTAEWLKRVNELVCGWRDEVNPMRNSDAVPIRPERICKEMSDALPANAILMADTGHAGIWTGTMVELKHASQSYIRAAGSLGWSLPAAIGAKCGAPERPVVCFTGDGGFWYHLGELETAVRYNIAPVIIVNDNHSLNQVARFYKGQSGTDDLWQYTNVDISKVADAIGCYSLRVTDPHKIRGALDLALASGRPSVVDIVTDIDAVAARPWGE